MREHLRSLCGFILPDSISGSILKSFQTGGT